MKKRVLETMRSLQATPQMMQMAAEDTPRREKHYYTEKYFEERVKYKQGLYMSCAVQNGILMVAFFFAEHLRAGGRNPAYELFVDNVGRRFITFDRKYDKWRTAKLDILEWPSYTRYSGKWINQFESALIKNYLGGTLEGYDGLLAYQFQIRAEELALAHKKETDPWDKDIAQTIPKLPKDWERWTRKVGIQENYIFYQYIKKGADTGYCSYCEKDVPIKKPRHNKEGRCPCCRHKIIFKAVGKAGMIITKKHHMYLIQRCSDGFVLREFTGYRKYNKGEYENPNDSFCEIRSVIYDKSGKFLRAYYWGDYKNCGNRWIKGEPCGIYWFGYFKGKVYGKTLPSLAKKELRQTGLPEALKCSKTFDPEKYLSLLKAMPHVEKLAKAQFPYFLDICIYNCHDLTQNIADANASSLTKMLGINSQQLKRARQHDGDFHFLKWLRYEKSIGKIIPDDMITWFCAERIKPDDFGFIKDRMSIIQIYNYLRRQSSAYRKSGKDILGTWADYLSMAKRLKMDVNDAIVFRVNKLYQRHDELVELCHAKTLADRLQEISKQYPHVDSICKTIKEKYEYASEAYTITAPSCIKDILLEARALHHCADDDRYFERIERHETYVLFLRKTSETDKPYYTLEVEPNATVRQKRTMFDRQNADIEDATKFLLEWQKVIAKRLTANDLILAEESRVLRIQEYAQLRENRAIIRTGDLAGKLLVDVLLADLMENKEIQKAA